MGRQQEIPGTEQKRIKELEEAAEVFFKQAKSYGKAGEKVAAAKEALVAIAKKHGVTSYTDKNHVPPLAITLAIGKDRVKVRPVGEDRGDEDDDETDSAAA